MPRGGEGDVAFTRHRTTGRRLETFGGLLPHTSRVAKPGIRPIRPHLPFSVCLCADDYALAPGVSRAILEALAAGVLTATSAMTTSPSWPESAPALKEHEDHADIGLHVNLTLGEPLGAMPTLAPTGTLPGLGPLMRRVASRTLPAREVAAEIGRQMDRFAAAVGRAPDHVDGHQHVHVLPVVRSAILAELGKRGWRPWLRDSGDAARRILRRRIALRKALGLTVLARGLRAAAHAASLTTNDGFSGVSAFAAGDDYATAFERYLVAPGPRHLVMCHPGYVDDDLRRLDPVVDTREQELAFLLSARFHEVLARRGAHLGRLSRPDIALSDGS